VATDPAEFNSAQNVVDAQLMSAVDSVPSVITVVGCPQVPDCQVETVPSDRATTQKDVVGHDTE
jgi:hypothetical protein